MIPFKWRRTPTTISAHFLEERPHGPFLEKTRNLGFSSDLHDRSKFYLLSLEWGGLQDLFSHFLFPSISKHLNSIKPIQLRAFFRTINYIFHKYQRRYSFTDTTISIYRWVTMLVTLLYSLKLMSNFFVSNCV